MWHKHSNGIEISYNSKGNVSRLFGPVIKGSAFFDMKNWVFDSQEHPLTKVLRCLRIIPK